MQNSPFNSVILKCQDNTFTVAMHSQKRSQNAPKRLTNTNTQCAEETQRQLEAHNTTACMSAAGSAAGGAKQNSEWPPESCGL